MLNSNNEGVVYLVTSGGEATCEGQGESSLPTQSMLDPLPDLCPAAAFWEAAGLPERLRPQFRISEQDVLEFRASQVVDAD